MLSLATREPNRLVMPRRLQAAVSGLRRREARRPPSAVRRRPARITDSVGCDLDVILIVPAMMSALILSTSAFSSAGILESKSWYGRQPGALVLQGADVRLVGEAAVLGRLDGVDHRDVHALVDAGHDLRAVGLGADAAVGVDPDRVDLAAAGLGRLQGAFTGRTGHREDDVGALAGQALGDALAAALFSNGLSPGTNWPSCLAASQPSTWTSPLFCWL